jgi:hypothetical protein
MGAKVCGAPKFAEDTDLYWDNVPEEVSSKLRCQRGAAMFAVKCPFCGTQKYCCPAEPGPRSLRLHLHAGFAGY